MNGGEGKGPAPVARPSVPAQPVWDGPSLLAKYADVAAAVKQSNGKLRFTDGHWIDWMPPGQWLVAMEHCQRGHTVEHTGDPCWCRSDNCAFCVRCGAEDHD